MWHTVGKEIHIIFWLESHNEKDHSGDQGMMGKQYYDKS